MRRRRPALRIPAGGRVEEGAGPDHLDEPREVEERDVESTTSPSKCILCWNFRVAVFDAVKNAVPLLYLFMFDVDKGAGSDRLDAHFDRFGPDLVLDPEGAGRR